MQDFQGSNIDYNSLDCSCNWAVAVRFGTKFYRRVLQSFWSSSAPGEHIAMIEYMIK